jgi:tRNA1Val (adenine37-N6)-methyltransferase
MNQRDELKAADETLDSFYHGRIHVLQKKKGYRFAVDAPLLADFIQTRASDEVLELGAGNGIICVLLSIKPFRHITAVEIQDSLANLARRNLKLNRLGKKISIVREDLRRYRPGRKFDVIFSNPPYIKRGVGYLSSSQEKSVAKHELECDILDVMEKAADLLKAKGRAYFVYHTKRKDDFLRAMEKSGLKLKAVRFVHPSRTSPARLFLAECGFHPEKETVLPPFVLYDEQGHYTAEAEEIFRGRVRV